MQNDRKALKRCALFGVRGKNDGNRSALFDGRCKMMENTLRRCALFGVRGKNNRTHQHDVRFSAFEAKTMEHDVRFSVFKAKMMEKAQHDDCRHIHIILLTSLRMFISETSMVLMMDCVL